MTTERCAAGLVSVISKTAIYYFHRLRQIISDGLAKGSAQYLTGELEVDESYSGGVRKGNRGRGAGGKTPVIGLLRHGGKVYTVIIPDANSKTLMPVIRKWTARLHCL